MCKNVLEKSIYFHFLRVSILSLIFVVSFGNGNADSNEMWKDDWILEWSKRATVVGQKDPEFASICSQGVVNDRINCSRRLPRYLPARVKADYTQVVPMVIWQTWKSVEASGPNHYAAVMSFINHNPEYEYYLFDDEAALEFMCTFYPEQALIYQQVAPGAAKADLWRLAIIYRYGGVYFDTDSESIVPLRNIIWQNASAVSGLGSLKDFHQWALIYRPLHPIIKTTLKIAVHRLRQIYNKRTGGNIVTATGPGALSTGVDITFQMYSCAPLSQLTRSKVLSDIIRLDQSRLCMEAVGVLQIYSGDFLGNKVRFKHKNADAEKNAVSLYYGGAQQNFDTLFQDVYIYDTGKGTVTVGECHLNSSARLRALALARRSRAASVEKS